MTKPVLQVEITVTTGPVLTEAERAAITAIMRETCAQMARRLRHARLADPSTPLGYQVMLEVPEDPPRP